ncbi:hypothetical protein [Kitasatospora sp. NPDC057223]|uniref:hypothetical protein n=1 Tax=Kitasatospora sp. NPDC057223 TaxID=3346055 RepID=UPI0036344115
MSNLDVLLVDIAAMVESEHGNQMSLTLVIPGAVITGRLAPVALWGSGWRRSWRPRSA